MSLLQPTGIGMYTRAPRREFNRPGELERSVALARDSGLSFIAFLACWQEAERHGAVEISSLVEACAAFREGGVEPWLWGYPWGSEQRVREFCSTVGAALAASHARGVILDPELGFKGNRQEHMPALLSGTIDVLSEAQGLGFTSYGLISAHKDFPWTTAGGHGWGSPQLYTVPLNTALLAIGQWRKAGWKHLVASAPTYGPNSEARLAAYSGAILEHVDGLIFWQWALTSPAEWRAVEALAKRLDDREAPPAREMRMEDVA